MKRRNLLIRAVVLFSAAFLAAGCERGGELPILPLSVYLPEDLEEVELNYEDQNRTLDFEWDASAGIKYTLVVSLSENLANPLTVELDASGKDSFTHTELDKMLDELGVGAYRKGEIYWAVEGSGKKVRVASRVRSMSTLRFFGPLTDLRDGETYSVIRIVDSLSGYSSVWMSENMRAVKYSDGVLLAENTDYTKYDAGDAKEGELNRLRGALYTWSAAVRDASVVEARGRVQGICPDGWHMATRKEWEFLTRSQPDFDTSPAVSMRGSEQWPQAKLKGDDRSGFNAVPSGFISSPLKDNHAEIRHGENRACFWLADVPAAGDNMPWGADPLDFPNHGYAFYIDGDDPGLQLWAYPRESGMSVRCVLNE